MFLTDYQRIEFLFFSQEHQGIAPFGLVYGSVFVGL